MKKRTAPGTREGEITDAIAAAALGTTEGAAAVNTWLNENPLLEDLPKKTYKGCWDEEARNAKAFEFRFGYDKKDLAEAYYCAYEASARLTVQGLVDQLSWLMKPSVDTSGIQRTFVPMDTK